MPPQSHARQDAPTSILASEGLHLDYQPLVQMSDEATVGYEALSRWTDPVLGSVPAETFISNSEQSGEIVQLGHQVLAILKTDFPALITKYPAIRISTNASPIKLNDPDFANHFSTWLQALPPDATQHLTLEVTETSLMELSEVAIAYLHTLREMEIQIAIDDFGTGQSSLARLHSLPFDIIKIDKSFIYQLHQPMAHEIVRWVITFGQRFGKKVVAEGVETQDQ